MRRLTGTHVYSYVKCSRLAALDLHLPRSHQLVSRAVSLQSGEEPSEETMADMFAGLYNSSSRRAG